MKSPAERAHALALAERLEHQADLHSDWLWASGYLTAAAAIRHLAGLPRRPEPEPIIKAKSTAPKKGTKR